MLYRFVHVALLCLCVSICLLAQSSTPPLDAVVASTSTQARLLSYPSLQEADVVWQKRIWQRIDTRELINQTFRYRPRPLMAILIDGVRSGAIVPYSAETDDFTYPLTSSVFLESLVRRDTLTVYDPVTGEPHLQPIIDEFDPERVLAFRLKEIHYFDSRHSSQRIRILGIAPIVEEVVDELGEVVTERALCWFYVPDARAWLAKQPAYLGGNDQMAMTWADVLEMRFFDSYITKEANVNDERLQDQYTGRRRLLKSQQIETTIQNREMDLWEH